MTAVIKDVERNMYEAMEMHIQGLSSKTASPSPNHTRPQSISWSSRADIDCWEEFSLSAANAEDILSLCQ